MEDLHITILGTGLIGGSIALALKEGGWSGKIVGIDRHLPGSVDSQSPATALQSPSRTGPPGAVNAFDAFCWADERTKCEEWLARTHLAILAMPVGGIIANLPEVLDATSGFVTDCGSTKYAIQQAIKDHPKRERFVPGHPMAGRPIGGIENSLGSLFRNRKWVLCPELSSHEALSEVKKALSLTGCEVIEMSAIEHDKNVALTSHLPQILASALSANTGESARKTAGPGFDSAVRVAGGGAAMWRDIFKTNAGPIARELKALALQLEGIAQELEEIHQTENKEAPELLLKLLALARSKRQ
ncbi:MAG: prephenate dehydrogenase/arogenate dehydrogenase family protein [Polyangiaceae bacterium]|nr:prephenate dehydrogenase/arogenate dehydrogenase family protein [Polyangiaceae bacterium]